MNSLSYLLILGLSCLCASAQDLSIMTQYGPVVGQVENGVRVWRGVPFAAPPIGSLRFRQPVAPTPWTQPLQCTSSSAICPQGSSVEGFVLGSEDCLYLDIYAPLYANATSKLPVMYWIYGGAWIIGDKYEAGLYDATNLVNAHGHVHVAVNYRLSALGFLSLPGLAKENPFNSVGNYGLQDQQFGMIWTKNNIAAFGGDPKQVTIFGESAGGFSVCWHLAAPSSAGLFRAAIIESGNCQSPNFFFARDDAFSFGSYYSGLVGCDATRLDEDALLDCLRNLTLSQILGAGIGAQRKMSRDAATDGPGGSARLANQFYPGLYPVMPWGSTIDKSVKGLMDLPLNVFLSGKHNKVPVLLGTNHNEGNIFIPALPLMVPGAWFPLDQYRTLLALQHFFNDTTSQQILNLYEFSASTYEGVMANAIRDLVFTCEARRVANALAKYNRNIYLYSFNFVAPNWIDQWVFGDYHSSELEYVYSNPWPPLVHIFDSDDIAMANAIGTYWTQFATTGNSPNSNNNNSTNGMTGNIQWPVYNNSIRAYMNLTLPLQVGYNLDFNCDFWDSVQNWKV